MAAAVAAKDQEDGKAETSKTEADIKKPSKEAVDAKKQEIELE